MDPVVDAVATATGEEDQPQVEAHYALETPVFCSHCEQSLRTVYVVRLLRTKVNFTSSLSRRGYAVVCPACRHFLPATIG